MLFALLVAVLAVALGAALTVVSGARPAVLGLLRTFAATAAAAVVLTHLLPDALAGAGLWGALSFLVGLLGPLGLHPLTARLASRRPNLSPSRVALEAGFIGLLVHHVGDGLGIGAYAALPGGVFSHLDVILALVAHTMPLVAVVTLAYRGEYGLGAALVRAAALALASVIGVGISFTVPADALSGASAWIGALVSGALLHVVTHDWLEDLPRTELTRLLDFAAAALGLSLVLLGGSEPGHETAGGELLRRAVATAEAGAPFLLLGLVGTFLLGDRVAADLERLAGASLPRMLTTRLGFALGPEGLALGLSTYGIAWTLAAVLATTLVPLVAGAAAFLALTLAGERATVQATAGLAAAPDGKRDRASRFDRATAIWLVAVALAAMFSSSLRDGALYGSLARPSELAVSALSGALLGTGGPAVVALGALTEKGLSPGAALLAATLSSALGARLLIDWWRALGPRALLPVVIWLMCLTGAIAIGLNRAAPVPNPLRFAPSVGRVAALVVLAMIVVRTERVGLRRWLAGWSRTPSTHAHHHHAHAHPHSSHHSSEIPNGSAATKRSPEASGPSAEA